MERDDDQYMNFASLNLNVTVGGGEVRLENLFNGDNVLCMFDIQLLVYFFLYNSSVIANVG